ncbi:unnamed protein product [Pleuronectes platessa]|uniref:Uncharacterized protein n=1 Tax=Pleuronectes platessa TaxID=8262 RepID=A0A9N7YG75_PLEPL|nr:unnamed protein product [Pleuronectes platessa]
MSTSPRKHISRVQRGHEPESDVLAARAAGAAAERPKRCVRGHGSGTEEVPLDMRSSIEHHPRADGDSFNTKTHSARIKGGEGSRSPPPASHSLDMSHRRVNIVIGRKAEMDKGEAAAGTEESGGDEMKGGGMNRGWK